MSDDIEAAICCEGTMTSNVVTVQERAVGVCAVWGGGVSVLLIIV